MLLDNRNSDVGLIKLIPVIRVNERHLDLDTTAEQILMKERDRRPEPRTRADSIQSKSNSRRLVGRRPALEESPGKSAFCRAKQGLRAPFDPGQRIDRALECVDRKSTRLNSSHSQISYAVFCLKKKNTRCRLGARRPPRSGPPCVPRGGTALRERRCRSRSATPAVPCTACGAAPAVRPARRCHA